MRDKIWESFQEMCLGTPRAFFCACSEQVALLQHRTYYAFILISTYCTFKSDKAIEFWCIKILRFMNYIVYRKR